MAGFFDWLTGDGSPVAGTYLMSVLDPPARANTPTSGESCCSALKLIPVRL